MLRALAESRLWERLVGSELHPAGLAYARKRLPSEVEFVQMDARNIPGVGIFDLTGAFDVVEHIADDEGVLRGLRAAPNRRWHNYRGAWAPSAMEPADDLAHHQRRYRSGELECKLRRNGFEVLFSSSFTALLLPVMAAGESLHEKEQ